MNFINRALILIEAAKMQKEIKSNHDRMKNISIIKASIQNGMEPTKNGFPNYMKQTETIDKFINNINHYKSNNDINKPTMIGFGDSLLDFTRKDLTILDNDLNFGQAGSGSPNFTTTALTLLPLLKGINISHVLAGCFGGNPLLSYQDIEICKQEATNAFKSLRQMFPNSKLLIYGLPPVYDKYVILHKIEFESHMMELVNDDYNSCYISFQKQAGLFGIFPRITYSSDGVHFIGKGKIEFNNLIEKAKTSIYKIVV